MERKFYLLYAEDDPDDQDDMKLLINEVDGMASLKIFNNGLELIQSLLAANSGEEAPFCIFLDVNMPIWDGIKTLRELKADGRYSHIPVIMWSTSTLPKDKELSLLLGAKAFITKPVQHSEWSTVKQQLSGLFDSIRLNGHK